MSSGVVGTPGTPRGRGRPSASRGRALRGRPPLSRSRSPPILPPPPGISENVPAPPFSPAAGDGTARRLVDGRQGACFSRHQRSERQSPPYPRPGRLSRTEDANVRTPSLDGNRSTVKLFRDRRRPMSRAPRGGNALVPFSVVVFIPLAAADADSVEVPVGGAWSTRQCSSKTAGGPHGQQERSQGEPEEAGTQLEGE